MTEPHREQWHIKKEVSVSHIISTLVITIAGFWFMAGMDKRIDANDSNLNNFKAIHAIDINAVKTARSQDMARVEKQFDRINHKLDQIISYNQKGS